MPDQDPLAGRFAAFREASVTTAQPPGVAAVQRTVARRRASRTLTTAGVAVAVVALLTGTFLWVIHPGPPPRPAESASPAPSAAVSITPNPTTQPTPSTSASSQSQSQSQSRSPAGPKVPAQTGLSCSYQTPGQLSQLFELLVNENNQLYLTPSDYFSHCPQTRIPVYAARYQWDVNGQQYTVAHVDHVYLTAASPTAALPTINPASLPGCGYAFIIAESNVDPPGTYPTSLTGAPANMRSYWSQHNLGYVISDLLNTYTPAEQANVVGCQPPGGSTASPTP